MLTKKELSLRTRCSYCVEVEKIHELSVSYRYDLPPDDSPYQITNKNSHHITLIGRIFNTDSKKVSIAMPVIMEFFMQLRDENGDCCYCIFNKNWIEKTNEKCIYIVNSVPLEVVNGVMQIIFNYKGKLYFHFSGGEFYRNYAYVEDWQFGSNPEI